MRIGQGLLDESGQQPALVQTVAGVFKAIGTVRQIQRTADTDQPIQQGDR
jgi:hypothetical protein